MTCGEWVGGVPSQVEGASQVEVSMLRMEVDGWVAGKGEVVPEAGNEGVNEVGAGEVEMAKTAPDEEEGGKAMSGEGGSTGAEAQKMLHRKKGIYEWGFSLVVIEWLVLSSYNFIFN